MRRIAAALAMSIAVPTAMSIVVASPSSAATLSCAQMKSRGYSYARAVDYWRGQGYPSRLDADNTAACVTGLSNAKPIQNNPAAIRPLWLNMAITSIPDLDFRVNKSHNVHTLSAAFDRNRTGKYWNYYDCISPRH